MPTVGGTIYLTSQPIKTKFTVMFRDMPTDTMWFLGQTVTEPDPAANRVVEVLPGVFVHPRQCAVITGLR